jgi:hypothetical protein
MRARTSTPFVLVDASPTNASSASHSPYSRSLLEAKFQDLGFGNKGLKRVPLAVLKVQYFGFRRVC